MGTLQNGRVAEDGRKEGRRNRVQPARRLPYDEQNRARVITHF
jgi:hypothetical protein